MPDGPSSYVDRPIAQRGHLRHKLQAKDATGYWTYYFVLVEPMRERAFLEALKAKEGVGLEDYGRVIASNYGEEPSAKVKAELKERFGCDV